jgi:hypothetical protein
VPLEKVQAAKHALLHELSTKHAALTKAINTGDKPTDEQQAEAMKVANEVTAEYAVEPAKAGAAK